MKFGFLYKTKRSSSFDDDDEVDNDVDEDYMQPVSQFGFSLQPVAVSSVLPTDSAI